MLLAACNSASSTITYASLPAPGDSAAGQSLYERGTKDAQACSSCHSIDGSAEVGPGLEGIADRAGKRIAGQSGDEYLFTSIVRPNDYLVPGYSANIMPANYAQALTAQQIRDLIAYQESLH